MQGKACPMNKLSVFIWLPLRVLLTSDCSSWLHRLSTHECVTAWRCSPRYRVQTQNEATQDRVVFVTHNTHSLCISLYQLIVH